VNIPRNSPVEFYERNVRDHSHKRLNAQPINQSDNMHEHTYHLL